MMKLPEMGLISWDNQSMSANGGGGGEIHWSYSAAPAAVELHALEAECGPAPQSAPGVWSWHERGNRSGWITFTQLTLVDLSGPWPADRPAPSRAFPPEARCAVVDSRGSVRS